MTASNRDRTRTTTYSATAGGIVKRNSAGVFYKEYEWSDVVWNGAPVALPEANRGLPAGYEEEKRSRGKG